MVSGIGLWIIFAFVLLSFNYVLIVLLGVLLPLYSWLFFRKREKNELNPPTSHVFSIHEWNVNALLKKYITKGTVLEISKLYTNFI